MRRTSVERSELPHRISAAEGSVGRRSVSLLSVCDRALFLIIERWRSSRAAGEVADRIVVHALFTEPSACQGDFTHKIAVRM
jgi:hypothetical protein